MANTIRLGGLFAACPDLLMAGNIVLGSFLQAVLNQITNLKATVDGHEAHFENCIRFIYEVDSCSYCVAVQDKELVNSVERAGLFYDFRYQETEGDKLDKKLLQYLGALAGLRHYAEVGSYFEVSDDGFKTFLMEQFYLFHEIGLLNLKTFECFGLINNANWMVYLLYSAVFGRSCCRTHMFEILDLLSPFPFNLRKGCGGTQSNCYHRHYILFYIIAMVFHPTKLPPAPRNALKMDFRILQPMSPTACALQVKIKESIMNRYQGEFIGMNAAVVVYLYRITVRSIWLY